ncbi:MAG: hypothetical protein OEX19_15140 [Gammaproteobacteria bacterium]|nr:hypothetical protein [Gammaproteobacteria bacterium]
MKEKLGIGKAARLLNVSRGEIQALIKSGQLETFEGMVFLEDLKELFPTISIDLNSVFRDLDFIRKAAYSNRVQSRLFPGKAEDAEKVLEKVRMKLLVEQQKSAAYSKIMHELMRHMVGLRVDADDGEKKVIDSLSQWLAAKLDEVK